MANALILWPNRSDSSVLYTPTASGGAWLAALPLTNLQDPDLSLPARSLSARRADARMRWDLQLSRSIRGIVIPKSNLSSAGRFRIIGTPGDLLFSYEAGDDVAALGATFARTPTAGALAATYVDKDGVVQYAGENRVTYSEQFDNAAWTKSSVTIAADSVAAPIGTGTTADTLTASGSNGTCRQGVTTVAVSYTFSIWLKRKTGTGTIEITMDGSTYVAKTLTTGWQRFSVTQTGVAGTSNPGVRIVTSGDAVYAWGAQVEIGSAAKSYLPATLAAVSAIRDDHWVDGVRTTLIEGQRTNLVPNNVDLSTWTDATTPVVTGGQADPFGGTDGWLIEDDDPGAAEYKARAITFTGDAVKAFSVCIRAGTASQSQVRVRDNTASADRLLATITWSGSDPGTPTMATGTYLGKVALTGGWYRLFFQTTSVTAANTNQIWLYGAISGTTPTGSTYYASPQAEDVPVPSSIIRTTGSIVTRSADVPYLPFTAPPQAMTAYVRFFEAGTSRVALDGGIQARVLQIGLTGAGTDPRFQLDAANGTGRYQVTHDNATAAVTSTLVSGSAPAIGDLVELRAVLNSDGSVQIHRSVNGAAETSATASSAPSGGLATAWAGERLYLGCDPAGANGGQNEHTSVTIAAGVQTMDYMRSVVHDSGWLDAWPSGATAETVAGMNLPMLYLLDEAQDIRYVSVQIDDEDNADGYIDKNRLIVAPAFQPTVNVSYGAGIGVETATRRERGRTGKAFYETHPRYRYCDFTLGSLTETESMVDVLDFMRIAGIHEQFYFIFDPADTTHMHRRSFLAVLNAVGTVTYPDYDRRAVVLRAVEEI